MKCWQVWACTEESPNKSPVKEHVDGFQNAMCTFAIFWQYCENALGRNKW